MQVSSLFCKSPLLSLYHSPLPTFHPSFFLGDMESLVFGHPSLALGIPYFHPRVLPSLVKIMGDYRHTPPPHFPSHPYILVSPIRHPPVHLIATHTISSTIDAPFCPQEPPHPSSEVYITVNVIVFFSLHHLVLSSAPVCWQISFIYWVIHGEITHWWIFLYIMNEIDFRNILLNFML